MISNHMFTAVAGTPWFPRAIAEVHSAPAAVAATAAAARKRRATAGTAAASVRGFH